MTLLNTNDPNDLLFGSAESIAQYLGVTTKTVRRWKDGQPLPPTAFKLLQLRYGDLSGLMGEDWQGFTFGRDGKLYPPFFRGGFSAPQICGMFFEMQGLRHLRRENKRIQEQLDAVRIELEKEKAHNWATQKVQQLISG